MLRTNLASRPFYNVRAVRLAIAAACVLVAALTVFNVLEVWSLNARHAELTARVQSAQAQTAQHREAARTIVASLNEEEMTSIQEAARVANRLIEQRAFSWTDLFNRFETTLPADVRISAVQPQFDRAGRMLVAVSVVSREVEHLNAFMDQLEQAGGFRDVISRQDTVTDDGMLVSVVQGYYDPRPVAASDRPAPASDRDEPSDTAPSGNGSPEVPRGDPE